MSILRFCIVIGLLVIGLGVLAMIQSRSHARFQQQSAQLARVSADNQRLSNLLAQVRLAQADAKDQFQELVRLRAELSRVRQENQQSNLVELAGFRDQLRELSKLPSEVDRLLQENQQLEDLREEIAQLRAALASSTADETRETDPAAAQDRSLSIRMINTQGDTFAEKLKRSAAASDEETFYDVFTRFLNNHGVQTNTVAAAVFDQRTGRIIVRSTQATLDQVERLIRALDQEP